MARVINWCSFSAVSLLLLLAPFQRGLFFDSDFYVFAAFIAVTFLVNFTSLYNSQSVRYGAYLLVFLLPLTHLVSLTDAESIQGSVNNLIRWVTYSSLFILLIRAKQTDKSGKVNRWLPDVFHFTGITITLFSLFGMWGWIEYKDLMLEERLTGPFQYANTFAAVISAYWLFAMVFLSKRQLAGWNVALFSLPLVAYGVGLLHSYSRGALLMFPIAWFVGLLLLKGKAQITYTVTSLASMGASLLVFRQMTAASGHQTGPRGLLALIVSTLVVVAIVIGVRYFLENRKRVSSITDWPYNRYVLPGFFVLLGLLGILDIKNQGLIYQQLPSSLQTRLSDIHLETASALGRTNVYQDAFRISHDAPVFGLGGEGWKIAYPRYQEIPYLNNEVHNGYLEVLVSNGWFGAAVFVLVFGYLLFQVGARISRQPEQDQTLTKAVLAALSMIFLHAAIDFDFSYGAVWFLVFWMFAMGVPNEPIRLTKWSSTFDFSQWRKAIVVLTALFVLGAGMYTVRLILAELAWSEAKRTNGWEQALAHVEQAVELNPYNVDYQIALADLYAQKFTIEQNNRWQEKAIEHLKTAEHTEPHHAKVLFAIGNVYVKLNDVDQATRFMERALKYDRFYREVFDRLIYLHTQVAVQSKQAGDARQAISYAKEVKRYYEKYQERFEPFKTMQIPDKRPLDLDAATYLFLAQAQMLLGENEKAIEYVKAVRESSLSVEAQAIRVVAYELMGQREQAATVTATMIARHADFAQKIVKYRSLLR